MDYEAQIMDRQERLEIWEDDPDDPYLQISPAEDSGSPIGRGCPPVVNKAVPYCDYNCDECWTNYYIDTNGGIT